MRTFKYILLSTLLVAFSCERTEIKPEPKILASFEAVAISPSPTKVSIDQDYVLSWEDSDKITVYDGYVQKLFVSKGTGKSVSFQAEGVVLSQDRNYVAVYPDTSGFFMDGKVTVKVPEVIAVEPDDFPAAPAVAFGNGKDRRLEFRNVCGLVSFDVKGNNVMSVKIEGAGSEVLAGYVAVDEQTGIYDRATIEQPCTSITVKSMLNGGMYPGKYYVPLLPQVFGNGLKITMQTAEGTQIERVFEDPLDLKPSYYHDLEGVDIGRFFRYEITSAAELVEFLNDAADPRCKSHVIAVLKRDIDLSEVELPSAETFRGTFDGNGKCLKNWTSKAPLFAKIESTAKVRNLEIASSCTIDLSAPTALQAFIVGQNEGLVSGCVNNASVAYEFPADQTLSKRTLGTIVGANIGKVSDCHNFGEISIDVPAQAAVGTDAHQRIGGVVGTFLSETNGTSVENCTNSGDIVLSYPGSVNVNLGGVCAQGCHTDPASEDDAVSAGTISGCTNSGLVSLSRNTASDAAFLNVGGIVGYMEGMVDNCTNLEGGKVLVASEDAEGAAVCSPAVGGVVGNILVGTVRNSTNQGSVELNGIVCPASAVAVYGGGNTEAAIGGVVAKVGKSVADHTQTLGDNVNQGAVTVNASGTSAIHVGGIVGWTSVMLSGSGSKKIHNEGLVWIKDATGSVNAGGVVGLSASKYSKIYNSGEVRVELGDAVNNIRIGGVAGYLTAADLAESTSDDTQPSYIVTGQNYGNINVSGGSVAAAPVYIGGVIGLSDIKNMTHNQTSWDSCNTNTADITVNSPVRVVVGGVVGREYGLSMTITNKVGKRTISGLKNRGNITVTSPGDNSYVGGLIGWHGRGVIANANNIGRYSATSTTNNDKAVITVTGANSTVAVGAVAGYLESSNGAAWGCSTVISGCGIWCDIAAQNATAGLLVGKVNFSGNSAAAGFMMGSSSGERPKYHVGSLINETAVGVLSEDISLSTFFGAVQKNGSDVTPIFRTGFAGGEVELYKTLQTY